MGAGNEELARVLVMVQDTGCRHVGMLPHVHRDFERLDERWRKKLERHFRNYGIEGTSMPPEQFKSEGRHPTGGVRTRDIQLWAFKAFQTRLYGTVVGIRGVQTFAGLELITDKKQQTADQELLKRVAKDFAQYQD